MRMLDQRTVPEESNGLEMDFYAKRKFALAMSRVCVWMKNVCLGPKMDYSNSIFVLRNFFLFIYSQRVSQSRVGMFKKVGKKKFH